MIRGRVEQLARLLSLARMVTEIPAGLVPDTVFVFYRQDGWRGVDEARVSGTVDGSSWATVPPPEWAADGRLHAEDAARFHHALSADGRESLASPGASPGWGAFYCLVGLAESPAELPEGLQEVVRHVLNVLAAEGPAGYALSEGGAWVRDKLVRDVKKRLAELRAVVGASAQEPMEDGADLTKRAVAWIRKTFENEGDDQAEDVKKAAAVDPWAPWNPDGERHALILRRLTVLVWRNGLQDEVERARRNRAALVRLIAAEVSDVQTRQPSLPGLEERELRDRRGRIVATIDASVTDLPLIHEGLDALRSPVGNRLMKKLVLTAHRQAEAEEPLYNRVQFDGGWSGVADDVGHSGRDFRDLKAVAKMGQYVNWQSRNGIYRGGGWWMVDEKRGGPGAPGYVRFTLADCFLPGFAAALARDGGTMRSAREARRLVPELPYEPPTGAVNERSRGAVWTLHRLFLLELVDNAEELARKGLVVMDDDRWKELAKVAGLPLDLLAKVHDSWADGESEKAPKMVERDGNGWRLALDVYRLEHEFLVDSGQRRIDGRKGGRKGAEKE